jgi:hypothetical protein
VEYLVLVDYLDRETDTARRLHLDRPIIPRATACETAMWQPFDQGRTIGKSGSEMGIILLDEENVDGARITLERRRFWSRRAPFAITCGIYGRMVHTRFFANEQDARRDYEDMNQALNSIIRAIPLKSDPNRDAKMNATIQMINEFVEQYP